MSLSIELNSMPIKVPNSGSVSTAQATEGYNVITITPPGNYSANSLIKYGGNSKTISVPPGSPVLYPLIQSFNNSMVEVQNNNTQEGQAIEAGWYSLSHSPTCPLSSSNTKVDQYVSIGGQSSSSIQTLTLTARTTSATLALLIVGGNKPVPVFLNINKQNLPPIWQTLDGAIYEDGNTYQVSKNFYGQYVYLVNLSLTNDSVFEARFQ